MAWETKAGLYVAEAKLTCHRALPTLHALQHGSRAAHVLPKLVPSLQPALCSTTTKTQGSSNLLLLGAPSRYIPLRPYLERACAEIFEHEFHGRINFQHIEPPTQLAPRPPSANVGERRCA